MKILMYEHTYFSIARHLALRNMFRKSTLSPLTVLVAKTHGTLRLAFILMDT